MNTKALRLAAILVLAMALLLPSFAMGQAPDGEYTYALAPDGTATITGYTGAPTALEIPAAVAGARVTAIGGAAFHGRQDIESVTIPEGVLSIGNAAFRDARGLKRVTLPATLTDLGESAFENCFVLESLVIPPGIRELKDRALQNCKALTSLSLPDGITAIGTAALSGLESLKRIDLPASLKTVGMGAFALSHGLEEIILPASVEELGYSAFHGNRNLKSVVLSTGLRKVDGGMFYNCPALERVAFPASIRSIDTSMLFYGSDKVTILGFAGSGAEALAKELKLPFEEVAPVKGIALTNLQGEDVTGQVVGIDLGGTERTVRFTAAPAQQTPWPLIAWKSSQPAVATVTPDGLVTGLKSGTATITASATDGNNHAVSINVNVAVLVKEIAVQGEDSVVAGKQTDLVVRVAPENADNRGVVWASSGPAAAINKNGRVSTQKVDALTTVELTATATDGSGVVGRHTLTIYPLAKGIALTKDGDPVADKAAIGIDYGSGVLTAQLQAAVLPADALQGVSFQSSAPKVVEVSDTGLLTAHSKGSANITVYALDGSGVKAAWKVNVATMVKQLSISGDASFTAGKRLTLTADALPEDADNKQVLWASSVPDAVTVSSGRVTAKGKLREAVAAVITATAKDGSGVTAQHEVTVYPVASAVEVYSDAEVLKNKAVVRIDINAENPTQQLTAKVLPGDAAQDVTWKSSHPRHATVDENGLITCVSRGDSTITVTAADGSGKRFTFNVKVSIHARELSLTADQLVVKPRDTFRIKATFQPEDVDSKALTWTSSDESVATVDTRGNVTVKRGITQESPVTITAVTKDGSDLSAAIEFTVAP